MKTLILLLCSLPAICLAQPGYINTIAGNGASGFSGDGGSATTAQMGQTLGVAVDGSGNVYIPDDDNNRIRKVTPTGIISTVAGGGSSTADGIPATNAILDLGNATGAIAIDAYGNIYIAQANSISKITAATGIITTIAGSGTSGFSGDGGPATAALLSASHGIYIDISGDIYIGDEGNDRVRKINTSGIISTVAGSGTVGYNGDGGPATAAQLHNPDGMCMDAMGNLYFADRYNYRIRKINPQGIISTYAGSGSDGFCGDGGPATAACFSEPSNVCMDSYGNLYIADFHNGRIRKVNPFGTVSTFAGGGSSLNSDIPATSASFSDTWGIGIDNYNNIYIPDRNHYRICKVNGGGGIPTAATDSFSVFVNSVCAGPSITISPAHYSASLHVQTWFGDGTIETDTFSAYSGYSWFNHIYSYPGIYTIKHVLYNGSLVVDSLQYSYTYVLCNTLPFQVYYDHNGNCVKDNSDIMISQPVLIEIDSNGMPVDTISTTSGIYYTAYGSIGDVYGFKVISTPTGFQATCPSTGIIYDTIGTGILSTPTKYIGLQCTTGSNFDLSINAIVPVTGVNDEWGDIYVQNHYCAPINGTLTLHYSPKYAGTPTQIYPPATSVSGNTIVWNLNSLTSTTPDPIQLHYSIWAGNATVPIGDTVNSYFEIVPTGGDADTTNNIQIIIDTVRGSCDPNEMWVSPASCIASGVAPTQLRYTINFENTGNDTAFNIYVMDTLSDDVDVSSMRIIMSSNEMYVSKLKDALGHNILKFDFPAINLLDSTHHGSCDGAVVFNIDTKPGLANGADIYNRAGIYFDDNGVVMTNQVDNVIGCPITTATGNVQSVITSPFVYPNPATDVLTINADNEVFESYTITNSIGKTMLTNKLTRSQTQLNIATLAAGLYFVNIKGEQGNVVRKFVKM